MAYSTYLGELAYTLTLDKTKFDQGISDASRKIKTFSTETNKADTQIKSLSRQTQVAGSSLASLGGVAILTGSAVGGDLGGAVQATGMGMAALGGVATTTASALKLVSVAGSGVVAALGGPMTALAVGAFAVGLGAVAYASQDAYRGTKDLTQAVKDQGGVFKDADDALKDYLRHMEEIKGIPQGIEELEFRKKGLGLDFMEATMALDLARQTGTPLDIAQAAYRRQSIERDMRDIDSQITALRSKPAALAPTMTREALTARGITTGEISAAWPGYWTRPEIPNEMPVIGGALDYLLGVKKGDWEKTPYGGWYDQYGARKNFLYNQQVPTVNITQNVTVSSAAEVKTVLEDSMSLGRQAAARGYI